MSTSQFCETCLKPRGLCDCMRDLLIVDRLLLSITGDKTRDELLSIQDLTLNKAIEICRGMEAASHHMKPLKNEEVNTIKDLSNKKSGQHKQSHRIKKPAQSVDQKAFKEDVSILLSNSCDEKRNVSPG